MIPVVTWSDVPSDPNTLSAFITALGKVNIPVEAGFTVMSNIILPIPVVGKFKNVKVNDLILRFKEEEIDRESFNREYKVLQNNYALIEKQITNFMNALYSQTNTYHSKSEENQYKSLLNLIYKKSVLEENEQSLKLSSNTVNKSEVINKNELEKFKRNYKRTLFCFVFLAVLNIVLILRGIIF